MSDLITLNRIVENLETFTAAVREAQETDGGSATFTMDTPVLAGSTILGQILTAARYDLRSDRTEQVVIDVAEMPDAETFLRAEWLAAVSDTYVTDSSKKTAKKVSDRKPNAAALKLAQDTVLWPAVSATLAAATGTPPPAE